MPNDPITAMQEKLCESPTFVDHYTNMWYFDQLNGAYVSYAI